MREGARGRRVGRECHGGCMGIEGGDKGRDVIGDEGFRSEGSEGGGRSITFITCSIQSGVGVHVHVLIVRKEMQRQSHPRVTANADVCYTTSGSPHNLEKLLKPTKQ